MLQVAFYDPRTDKIVSQEPFGSDIQEARLASCGLTALWASGRHRMPSPYWVAWDHDEDIFSVFLLDQNRVPKEKTLNRIKELVDAI